MKVYYHEFNTELGMLRIAFTKDAMVKLDFPNQTKEEMITWLKRNFVDINKYDGNKNEFSKSVTNFLEGKTKNLDIPIQLHGTDFQERVWEQLRTIPYGEVRTYKDIAVGIGNEKGSRAVGLANNRNPIPIIIPCHRVVGSNGSLVGFGGGLDLKVKLLELEGISVRSRIKKDKKEYYI